MSGIVGSKLNIRGSGRVAKLGTDGQVLTSSGAGVQANYEDAAGGGSSWQAVVTGTTLSAVAGNGYPINTTSNICTVTLPAGSVGDTIEFVDYAGTWNTNSVTLTTTEKIKGSDDDGFLKSEREGAKVVYVDATQGWVTVTAANETAPAITPPQYDIEFLVVAGGGGGGSGSTSTNPSGGGGAGGSRTSTQTIVQATVVAVAVGAGGAGGTLAGGGEPGTAGSIASVSGGTMETITSTGGGYGALGKISEDGGDGGCGGGGATNLGAGGEGNTPATDPSQGYDGGTGAAWTYNDGGGGGGAGGAGQDATSTAAGDGGVGAITTIMTTTMATDNSVGQVDGADVYFSGGGGGAAHGSGPGDFGVGGKGGGGAGSDGGTGTDGTVNTGGGGGGAGGTTGVGGAGGKGCVALKMLTADYTTTTTGTPDVDTEGSYTILTYTGDGSYTA